MPKRLHRSVPPLDPVIEKDAYNYLEQYDPEVLDAVVEAVDQDFTPEEIQRHWLRTAGWHRQEYAIRCKNAAKYYIRLREQS